MPSPIDELVKSFAPIMNNIILLLIGISVVIIISIIVLAYTTTTRAGVESSRERVLETMIAEEEAPATRRRRRRSTEFSDRDMSLLKLLDSRESMPMDTLKEEIGESTRVISERISKLRDEGLIEISGGVITLTRRGKRMMELLKEKYWYRDLEKQRR